MSRLREPQLSFSEVDDIQGYQATSYTQAVERPAAGLKLAAPAQESSASKLKVHFLVNLTDPPTNRNLPG